MPAMSEDPIEKPGDEARDEGEGTRRTGVPTGGPLLFLLLAGLLIAAAFLVPGEWIVKVSQLYNTPEADVDAFDTSVREVDEALQAGGDLPVTETQFRSLEPHIAARRLASVGKATGEEVRVAARIYREYRPRIGREESDGSKDAVRAVRNGALDEALPRVSAEAIDRELKRLADQIVAADFLDEAGSPPSDEPGRSSEACETCHLQLVDLPPGKSIDLQHLWPSLDPELLGSGDRLPDMMSAAETSDCTSCHAPHGDDDFGVTSSIRADNMGMWVHTRQVDSVVQVQVKVQNIEASHRVPAGPLSRAYVVVVRAENDGQPLNPWWGEQLPKPVADPTNLGIFMGRTAIGEDGEFVTDPGSVVDLLEDSRLEHQRFYDDYFLFELPDVSENRRGEVEVTVELRYYPDWLQTESTVIQRATRTVTLR